ncbi:TIGR00266 family protein [Thermithiobacillus plumbiphilus]|uniref:TIGR00266 family protein n=1 Tax=Thermithiobacillus plumbiphilus TaxID=1729899 RepID=A0ABU9DBF3_9PROT
MTQWYFNYENRQTGPLTHEEALREAKLHPDAMVWREGFSHWLPLAQVTELQASADPWRSAPPPVSQRSAHEIDYTLFGEEMQYVEIELDPGESAVAEAGSMMYKDASIDMQTVFGDASQQQSSGFMGKLLGAGKRLITGESLFTTVFTHNGHGKAHVAFAAPYPGKIIPVDLQENGGRLICQKDSFLCAARGVSLGIYFQRRIMTGLFGGEGFVMQKLEGDGMVFVHAGGTILKRELAPGEVLHVDTGCVVALQDSVDFDIVQAGGIKTMFFGGEGLFFATLRGPGTVWLQSLPFSRLAGRMLMAAPQNGGSVGEGSVLGRLGNILDGD